QQNLILGLQEQLFHSCLRHDADQNLISKLVGNLCELESRRCNLEAEESPTEKQPPKKRPSLGGSTKAPDDSDREIEEEECTCDESPTSEEPVATLIFACESESTGSRSSSHEFSREDRFDAACQTDGEDCTVSGSSRETSATRCSHHCGTALTGRQVGGGECTPSGLHV
ncbi:unnamed protein product, partial [Symbiodinium microadriaticum]